MLDSPEPPKSFLQKLQERAAASRFFTVSLIIHLGIVILGGSVVLFKMSDPPVDFSAGGGLVDTGAATPDVPEPPPAPQQELAQETPSLTVPSLNAIATTAAAPSFAVVAATSVPVSLAAVAMTPGVPIQSGMGKFSGGLGGRGGGKGAARAAGGGKDAGERAVLLGLQWLKRTQKSDGSWSEQDKHKAAMTGLAMLCFLGHGETSASPEFGETVQKGINWIMDKGKAQNGVLTENGRIDQPGSYTHGIVTYALGEYYTMTQDERAGEVFKQAIKLIVDGQGPDGGWMYSYDKSQSDTSVTGWQIQALKIAHLSGLNIEGVDAAMDKAMLNLKRVQTANGGFGYRTPEDRYNLSGIGLLCTYFWKASKDESVTKGLKYIMSQLEAHPVEYKHATADLYGWYYNTQAIFMVSGANGPEWKKWNAMFQDQLILSQKQDGPAAGSWPVMTHAAHGGLQTDDAGAGPYYRTTLAILMLEVYYRYAAPNAKGGGALGGSLGGSSLDKPMGSALDSPKPEKKPPAK